MMVNFCNKHGVNWTLGKLCPACENEQLKAKLVDKDLEIRDLNEHLATSRSQVKNLSENMQSALDQVAEFDRQITENKAEIARLQNEVSEAIRVPSAEQVEWLKEIDEANKEIVRLMSENTNLTAIAKHDALLKKLAKIDHVLQVWDKYLLKYNFIKYFGSIRKILDDEQSIVPEFKLRDHVITTGNAMHCDEDLDNIGKYMKGIIIYVNWQSACVEFDTPIPGYNYTSLWFKKTDVVLDIDQAASAPKPEDENQ